VLVARLVDALTEAQALKIEAELIAAFGTLETGGLLTNAVMPTGLACKSRPAVVVPAGVREKAQIGLALLKDAVLELAKANPQGISIPTPPACWGCAATMAAGRRTICRTA
jgi:hypothetical protein